MNKPLRIAYLDFDDIRNPLLAGGQSLATVAVGKRLVKRGHTVISICSRYPGSQDRIENGIEYRHIGLGSKYIRLNNLIYILALPFYLRRQKLDIVIECFTAPISTLGSPLYSPAPVVGLPSQFAAHEFARKYKVPFHWIEQALLPVYRYFLPYTEDVLNRMKKRNPSIIAEIVPHGADQEYFEVKKQPPEFILFLGRLDVDQKGLDLLLAAYAKVADHINYPLVIAGHGADEAKVKALINQYHLNNQVQMVGGTYGQKKLDLMAKAAVVAFPSRYDDLPIFVVEALAAGLPIVSFDIPELGFIERDLGFKATAFDVDEYAQTLLASVNSSRLPSMSEKCRTYARQFDWDDVASRFESFFREIVNHHEPQKATV